MAKKSKEKQITEITNKLQKQFQEHLQAEREKKGSLRVYIIAGIIALVVSLAVTFHSKWIPVVEDVVDKVVDIVTVDKVPDSE